MARMLLEEIKPWINPTLFQKMEESKQVRKNILESEEFKELGGWYLDEDGNLRHPLIESEGDGKKSVSEAPYEPSFGPTPEG